MRCFSLCAAHAQTHRVPQPQSCAPATPADTPDAVVAALNSALSIALAAPAMKQRPMEEGAQTSSVNTAEFGKFSPSEIATWAQAVKDSGASAH